MSKHWDESKEAELITSYLDSQFKNLYFLNVKERTETISLLRIQIIESSDSYTCTTTGSLTKNTQKHIMSKFFNNSNTVAQSSLDTELQLYNSLPLVLKHDLNHPKYEKDNLLLFWCKYAKSLPFLASQARIYLAILAKSVSSKCLFSDASNLLTDKHNQLDSNQICELLFLKENLFLFNYYSGLEI
ncbi:19762_t:CDS:1 [Cetraspora pellucida]|uniref:19762_t:CDS:1 n=1 Tax=Cetraspora pellucida TaxID=1433469 RepID=A0A9N9GW64_9GLOM|nr:19762_t:CDS:1 [Cetraspora pellucida]